MKYIIAHSDSYLMHYGVKGMKWGVRRYQNPDGSLTETRNPDGTYHVRRTDIYYY